VLGQLSGEEETDSSLDFPRGDGGPLVVVRQTGGLRSNTLEDVVDEGVHDGHGLGGDSGVRVDLLQDLVDVNRVRFLPLVLPLLISLRNVLRGLSGFLRSFPTNFRCHFQCRDFTEFSTGRKRFLK
jgi:hypothetical protein